MRTIVTVPYDPAMKAGRIRYGAMNPCMQRAWLAAAHGPQPRVEGAAGTSSPSHPHFCVRTAPAVCTYSTTNRPSSRSETHNTTARGLGTVCRRRSPHLIARPLAVCIGVSLWMRAIYISTLGV